MSAPRVEKAERPKITNNVGYFAKIALLFAIFGISLFYSFHFMSATKAAYDNAKYDIYAPILDDSSGYSSNSDNITVSVIRIKADDGVPLKALFFIDKNYLRLKDHSVPLIIVNHGMSSNYLGFWNFVYTLTLRGYAVISPEARGHGSNPAPSTLGYMEGKDIIKFLDYAETNLPEINASNSAIFGHSMGALNAMNAYILESHGKGRLKAIVSGSGPLNITREIYFLTNNPFVIGNFSLIDHLAEKNPITHVNSTFPRNILMFHGDHDTIVDFNCSVDFYHKIDPYNNRTDVNFNVVSGSNHNLPSIFYKSAIMWFDKYLLNKSDSLDGISIKTNPISLEYSRIFAKDLRYSIILWTFSIVMLIFLIPNIEVLIKGTSGELSTFEKKFEKIEDIELRLKLSRDIMENSSLKHLKYPKTLTLLIYFISLFMAGSFSIMLHNYLANRLFLTAIFSGIFLYVLFFRFLFPSSEAKNYLKSRLVKLVGDKKGILVGIVILSGVIAWFFISSSPHIENAVLIPGGRITWWIPFISLYIGCQMFINIILIRYLIGTFKTEEELNYFKALKKEHDRDVQNGSLLKTRLKLFGKYSLEPFIQLLLTALGYLIFLIYLLGKSYIIIPAWFSFNLELVSTLSIVFGLYFFLSDIIIIILERLTKSLLPGLIISSLILPIAIGASHLVFFY
ncbi:MAG: alpha/beta hydrolase family protein [Promethearchaeota archaeon]